MILNAVMTFAVLFAAAYSLLVAMVFLRQANALAHAIGFALLGEFCVLLCTAVFSSWSTVASDGMPEEMRILLRFIITVTAIVFTFHLHRTVRRIQQHTAYICFEMERELRKLDTIIRPKRRANTDDN